MKSKNIKIGLNNQQFLDVKSSIDMPDSCLVIDFLVEFSKFLKTEVKNVGTETIAITHFKFGNLQLRSTLTANINITEEFPKRIAAKIAKETVLLQNEKVIYKSANKKVQTELSAQQLIDLLKQNGFEISVIAYAENKSAKAALLSLKKIN